MLVTNPEKSPDSDADAPAPGAQSQQESQTVIGSTQGSVPGTPQLTVNVVKINFYIYLQIRSRLHIHPSLS